ncbi:IS4 family transposase, partial [Lysinibacillus sp. fls2-241-R2A-57]|uniref:IS4 family transposase n=1 Tax=Lysinibacillus sp. fls2-241-R2A-57 TaxID=3040292 RepID=UPI0025575448
MTTPKNVQLLRKLFEFIRPERVDEIAKETGFIKRKRLVTASDFLSLLFHVHGNLADCTIQDLCTKLLTEQDILISRAAVDKKFTPEATAFLQGVIQEFLHEQQQLQLPTLSLSDPWPFTSFRVLDSTTVSVPERFKKRTQKTQQATAKIQFEYDVFSGQSTFLHVAFKNINDAKIGASRIPFIEERELCIQDLGYFNFENFKKIAGKEAFFITKARTDAYAAFKNPFPSYHPNGEVIQSSLYHRIDFVALCEKL